MTENTLKDKAKLTNHEIYQELQKWAHDEGMASFEYSDFEERTFRAVAAAAQSKLLSLLSKEGKELPLINPYFKNSANWRADGRYFAWQEGAEAVKPYVTAANARAKEAEAENEGLKILMHTNEDVYVEKLNALQAQLDKANEEVERLRGVAGLKNDAQSMPLDFSLFLVGMVIKYKEKRTEKGDSYQQMSRRALADLLEKEIAEWQAAENVGNKSEADKELADIGNMAWMLSSATLVSPSNKDKE